MLVELGNCFFQSRNILFPVFYASLFIPSLSIFTDNKLPIILGAILISLGVITRCTNIGLVYSIKGDNNRQLHAENLVTEDVYKMYRNPMYLGNILLVVGFGIFANSILFLTIFLPMFLLFYLSIIMAEEHFLSQKFETPLENYKKSSTAMLPKLSIDKKTIAGFNFKRVISKAHNSLFLYGSGIILLLYTRYSVRCGDLSVSFALLLFGYLMVKILKKKNKLQ